jgi:hypothetical protein
LPINRSQFTIIAGDLNAKFLYWDPRLASLTPNAKKIDDSIDNGALLQNLPGLHIFQRKRKNVDIYRAVLDFTLSFSPMGRNKYTLMDWALDEEASALSDHETIRYTINCSSRTMASPLPLINRWRWDFWKSLPPPPDNEEDTRYPWGRWQEDFCNATKHLSATAGPGEDHEGNLDEVASALETALL